MDNHSKKLPKFGTSKIMFTPNLGYKRIAAKDSDQLDNVEVKLEHDDTSSLQSSTQKQKKTKERSTTQIQSVFSNMSSTSQGRSSRLGLSSGFRSYSNQGSFNSSGCFVKTEACQSIQQMQMSENNQFDVDDPIDCPYGPVRLPFFKRDSTPQFKSENSLEYPYQKNVYPLLTELITPESLMILQFYDSSFSILPKITDIDLTENGNNDVTSVLTQTGLPIKTEFNGHIKTENDPVAVFGSQPIGKVQYYKSGRVVLIFKEKEYELLKANEDRHHKELFSLTSVDEDEKPDKLVSLGTVPLRLKAVMDINSIIDNFLTNNN